MYYETKPKLGRFILRLIKYSILVLLLSTTYLAQTGKLSGTVVDGDLGESLIGANIYLDGTLMGAASDINGKYSIKNIPVGTYDVIFSSIGFAKKIVSGIEITDGETVKLDMVMQMESFETEEVVISAKAALNTEAGLLVKRQKSNSVSDAISAEQISRTGSGDAAEAVKQVVGASVVDGKEVFVRGLGDRYTNTQLNGAEIPSVDPYKRAGSIDLIPSSLVDNIQAIKSFTPDKPGNFSGGSVDITTKDFPERFTFNLSASTSYNSNSTFNNDFLGLYGSGTDWLGFDNGSRDIPDVIGSELWVPDIAAATKDNELAQEIDTKTKAFSDNFALKRAEQPINRSYGISIGNQVDFLGNPLGFLASLTYKRSFSGYTDGELNRWDRGVIDPNKTQLDAAMSLGDQKTQDDVLWGIVLKTSYKLTPKHILSFDGLFNQNGINTSRVLVGSYPYDTDPDNSWRATSYQYKERALRSYQVSGDHYFDSVLNIKFDWKATYMTNNQDEPDLRFIYDIATPDGNNFTKSNLEPERFWRNTSEIQRQFEGNFSIPFHFIGNKQSTFKFGGYYSNKTRGFNERRFIYEDLDKFINTADADFNRLFSDEYLGFIGQDTISFAGKTTIQNKFGIYLKETNQLSSNYTGKNEISAYYGMLDLPLSDQFRFIGGVRMESTLLSTTSLTDSTGSIDTDDLLPSASLVYSPTPNMNIRLSYGKTLARPTFREIAPFLNYDFNGGDTYIGNTELNRTLIDNYDIRWEWYTRPGEVFAISGFYKNFKDPIQLKIQNAVNQVLSWTNVPEAIVYGVEFEARTKLDFVTEMLSNFTLGGNVSLIESEVDINQDEFENIKAYEPDASSSRPFQGQSPYIVNFYLNYDNYEAGWSGTIYYNLFGRRLAAIGSVGSPDVYEEPFNLLNASVSKKFLDHYTIKLSVSNILDDNVEKTQEFKGTKYVYTQYTRGVTYSLSFKYEL